MCPPKLNNYVQLTPEAAQYIVCFIVIMILAILISNETYNQSQCLLRCVAIKYSNYMKFIVTIVNTKNMGNRLITVPDMRAPATPWKSLLLVFSKILATKLTLFQLYV